MADIKIPSTEQILLARLRRAEAVLKEFCTDIEIIGIDDVGNEWPDIAVTYAKAKALFGPAPLYVCQNGCGEFPADSVRVWLKDIPDLGERLSPGEIVPACECPMCGALAHRKEEDGTQTQEQEQEQ